MENSITEVEIAIAKYRIHPSVNVIIEKMEKLGNPSFGFDFTSCKETVQAVSNLKSTKVSQKKQQIFLSKLSTKT